MRNVTSEPRVAPHWGAWIEIFKSLSREEQDKRLSHPTGVRGLKSVLLNQAHGALSRTPLGCVD